MAIVCDRNRGKGCTLLINLFALLKALPSNCVTELTCPPDPANPLDVMRVWTEFYGIPSAAVLGIFVGMLVAGIFAHNKNVGALAIMGIYVTSIVSATWLNDAYIAPQYHAVSYIIAVAIGSVILITFLRTIREW